MNCTDLSACVKSIIVKCKHLTTLFLKLFQYCKFGHASKHFVYLNLSYEVASGSEITPCNKIDKLLVFYRFTGNVMTSITMTKL